MTALALLLTLLAAPQSAPAGAALMPVQVAADTADAWDVYLDDESVLQSSTAQADTAAQVSSLPYSSLIGRSTLTIHYVTGERYARARMVEFVDESGLVMFGYEEMEESEDNPMQIPLDALSLALGGAPDGPLTVTYRETSGGEPTRPSTVLFVISPE